jgi:hypothetical protein
MPSKSVSKSERPIFEFTECELLFGFTFYFFVRFSVIEFGAALSALPEPAGFQLPGRTSSLECSRAHLLSTTSTGILRLSNHSKTEYVHRNMRRLISAETWEQLQTAYAGGLGLCELARKMQIPSGTVLARAKRERWTQQIAHAKLIERPELARELAKPDAIKQSARAVSRAHDAGTRCEARRANCARHSSSRYYARTFGSNKEIWKSLRAEHLPVAKARLAEFLRKHRENQAAAAVIHRRK